MVLHMRQVKWLQCKWTQPWSSVDKKTINLHNKCTLYNMYDLVTVQIGLHSGAVVWIGNFGIKCLPPPPSQFLVMACTATGDKPTHLFSKMLWTIIAALENLWTGEGEGQTSNKKGPRHVCLIPLQWPKIGASLRWEPHPASIRHSWSRKMFLSSFWKRFKSEKWGNGLDFNKFNIMNNQCKAR